MMPYRQRIMRSSSRGLKCGIYRYNAGKEYELELVVEGNRAQFYIDGEDMGEWEDDQLETGMIGIRVWSAIMAVDDFDANGPGIPATAVDSQGKLAVAWGKVKQDR